VTFLRLVRSSHPDLGPAKKTTTKSPLLPPAVHGKLAVFSNENLFALIFNFGTFLLFVRSLPLLLAEEKGSRANSD